jgi:hypothetical protein
MSICGFEDADAIEIAIRIDVHDRQTTERRFRRKLAADLSRLLDSDDIPAVLSRARTIRKRCVQRGIYTRIKSSPARRTNPVDFRTNRKILPMPWRTSS